MLRATIVQSLLNLFQEPAYLEIGVNTGNTFRAVQAQTKHAVDPKFLFDYEKFKKENSNSTFFEETSDAYFQRDLKLKFDVIYLDGLHTFEQTLRDFMNATQFLKDGGYILIDDVMPNSYISSMRNLRESQRIRSALSDSDQSWMGDVYRLVFFIETFCTAFSYATVAENHGQTIVWREPRPVREDQSPLVLDIAMKSYESTVLERDTYRIMPMASILAHLKVLRAAH